jgi:hypothetical protein
MISLTLVELVQEVMEDASITHQHNEEVEAKVDDLPKQMENAKLD